MKRMISAIFALTFAGTLAAAEMESGGYTWSYVINGNLAKITNVSPSPSGDVDIPSTAGGKPVSCLGANLFQSATGLQYVGIPDSVREIGDRAFWNCTGLKEIILPGNLVSIGEGAFRNCSSLKRVDLFEKVTTLGVDAFRGCTGLEYAYLPSRFAKPSAELLGSSCPFYGCSQNLKFVFSHKLNSSTFLDFQVLNGPSIEIGNGYNGARAVDLNIQTMVTIPASINEIAVKRIGDQAFDGCLITSVIVPDGVEYIGKGAFNACTMLSVASLPLTLRGFGPGAFANCSALRSVALPIGFATSESSVRSAYFSGCPANLSFRYKAKDSSGRICTLSELQDGHATLMGVDPMPASLNISRVANYHIKTISIWAFANSAGLTTVKFSDSVEEIAEGAFSDCASLAKVAMSKNINYIGKDAFDGCPLLKTITVHKGDVDRVKALLQGSGFDVSGVNFVERTGSGDSDDDEPEYGIDPEAVDPFYPGDLPCYQVINPQDIWDPLKMPNGGSLWGAVYYGCDVVGIIEIKVGKPKKGECKVSGSMTLLDGKKYSFKSLQKVNIDRTLASFLNIDVKKIGMMSIAIGSIGGRNVFSGALMRKNYHVQTADAAGAWKQATAKAKVKAEDVSMFPGNVFTEFLPKGEVASVSGGKWTFKKAAAIKLKKGVLTGADDPAKPNLSGIKLTYKPKTGVFKGSFKVYTDLGGKLKKYTMKVNGVVVGGVGYGEATCKKPAVKWDVRVR